MLKDIIVSIILTGIIVFFSFYFAEQDDKLRNKKYTIVEVNYMRIQTKVLPNEEAKIEADRIVAELEKQGACIILKQKKTNYNTGNNYYIIEYTAPKGKIDISKI